MTTTSFVEQPARNSRAAASTGQRRREILDVASARRGETLDVYPGSHGYGDNVRRSFWGERALRAEIIETNKSTPVSIR